MPRVTRLQLPQASAMGIAVEGSNAAWPGAQGDRCFPDLMRTACQRRYIDIFNRGASSFGFTAIPSVPWIRVSARKGMVNKETRVWVTLMAFGSPRGGFRTGKSREGRRRGLDVKIESFNPRCRPDH